MKRHQILLFFLFFAASTHAQTGYNQLPLPQADLLGKPLVNLDIKKGVVEPNGTAPKIDFIYEIISGPTISKEFSERVRSLILPIFKKNKYRLVSIEVDTMKIKALSPENFYNGNINPGTFAYDGLIADTVRLTFRTSRDYKIYPAELIDSLIKYIPGGIWKDVANVAKAVNINGKDSVDRQLSIVNPDVIYAARFVNYTETKPLNGETFEGKLKKFASGQSFNLTIQGASSKARSGIVQPEWRGGTMDVQNTYFFKIIGPKNNLKLGLYKDEKTNKLFPGGRLIVEIPFEIGDDGMREYKLDYSTVDSYIDSKGFLRLFRIEVYAKQINPTSVQIFNNDEKDNLTYAKYPYFDFKYVTKK